MRIFTTQLYNSRIPSANIGSEPLEYHPDSIQQSKGYIPLQRSRELITNYFAYSVSNGGTCGWFDKEAGLNTVMNFSLGECIKPPW
jgi:hypothetical protein